MVEGTSQFLEENLPRLAEILADDGIVRTVPGELLAHDVTAAGPFAVLARRAAQGSRDRHARSNAWWLHAQALEFLDAAGPETERALRRALEASRDHRPAATDLAWHLDDRGQAGAALGLLVEHGLGETAWAEALRGWASPGPTTARRNDPCPCGSGRKHKVCCAPLNGWALTERVDWVLGKLTRFGARSPTTTWWTRWSRTPATRPAASCCPTTRS